MEASNVQKIREALVVVRDALTTISEHENDIEFVRTWIALTKKEVEQALALPLRQCDLYQTALDALHGWEDYLEKHPELPPSSRISGAMLPWLLSSVKTEDRINENN